MTGESDFERGPLTEGTRKTIFPSRNESPESNDEEMTEQRLPRDRLQNNSPAPVKQSEPGKTKTEVKAGEPAQITKGSREFCSL